MQWRESRLVLQMTEHRMDSIHLLLDLLGCDDDPIMMMAIVDSRIPDFFMAKNVIFPVSRHFDLIFGLFRAPRAPKGPVFAPEGPK